MTKARKKLSDLDTYVFIDASNIRAACLKTLGLKIDFKRFLKYLKRKYPKLKEVRYYEGIANDDADKKKVFSALSRAGYTVCSLSRKSYTEPAVYKTVRCRKCGNTWKTVALKKALKLKSNVDVYLATDFLRQAYLAKKPCRLILVSCDGDYAEMIRSAIESNKNVEIVVIATPHVRDYSKNSFSVRIRQLRGHLPRFTIVSIDSISKFIQ